jgi:hypothetical protein
VVKAARSVGAHDPEVLPDRLRGPSPQVQNQRDSVALGGSRHAWHARIPFGGAYQLHVPFGEARLADRVGAKLVDMAEILHLEGSQ